MPHAWEIELDGTRHRVELGAWGVITAEPRMFLSDGVKHSLGGWLTVGTRAVTFDLAGHVGVVKMRWVKPGFRTNLRRAFGSSWRQLPGTVAAYLVGGAGLGGGVAGAAAASSVLRWVIYDLVVDGESRGSWVLTSDGDSLRSSVFVEPGEPLPEPDWLAWPAPRGTERPKAFFDGFQAHPVTGNPRWDVLPDETPIRTMQERAEKSKGLAASDHQAARSSGAISREALPSATTPRDASDMPPDFSDAGWGQVGCVFSVIGIVAGFVIALLVIVISVVAGTAPAPRIDEGYLLWLAVVAFDGYVISTVAAVGSADLVTRVRALWRHADSITYATSLLAAAAAIVFLTLTPAGQAVAVPLALVSLVGGLASFAFLFLRDRMWRTGTGSGAK